MILIDNPAKIKLTIVFLISSLLSGRQRGSMKLPGYKTGSVGFSDTREAPGKLQEEIHGF